MVRTESGVPMRSVVVDALETSLQGDLALPADAPGVVLFAHGSGSSRRSPRNRYVAGVLNEAGIGTLLFDLLTPDEELDRENVFDIPLLAHRLIGATRWLASHPEAAGLALGYFGASTGAAAALVAAAEAGGSIAAVVSRGGRPDLAADWLAKVQAPTLLIVGERDSEVLALNQGAYEALRCPKRLDVVPGATHLFEERGAMEAVAAIATDWFLEHLRVGKAAAAARKA